MKKPLTRNTPRHLSENEWYYVNEGSIDLFVREPDVYTSTVRLTRAVLRRMLAELRPLRKRKATR